MRGLGCARDLGFEKPGGLMKGCGWMVERSRGHMGHIEGHFRDLFSCTILTKDFLGKCGLSAPCAPKGKNDF